MILRPVLRRALLALHLTVSVGWVGAVLAYLALGVMAVNATDDATVRSAWVGMETVGWFVIAPLAVSTLASGLLIALGTRWGLFRHYWVIISLLLTSVAVAVLLLHLPGVSDTAAFARTASGPPLQALGGDLPHAAGGLVILLVVLVLNIYKPRGATRYGRKRIEPSNSAVP